MFSNLDKKGGRFTRIYPVNPNGKNKWGLKVPKIRNQNDYFLIQATKLMHTFKVFCTYWYSNYLPATVSFFSICCEVTVTAILRFPWGMSPWSLELPAYDGFSCSQCKFVSLISRDGFRDWDSSGWPKLLGLFLLNFSFSSVNRSGKFSILG